MSYVVDGIKLAEKFARKAGEIRANTNSDEGELKARIYEGLSLELLKESGADAETVRKILSLAGNRREYKNVSASKLKFEEEGKDRLTVGGYDSETGKWVI